MAQVTAMDMNPCTPYIPARGVRRKALGPSIWCQDLESHVQASVNARGSPKILLFWEALHMRFHILGGGSVVGCPHNESPAAQHRRVGSSFDLS